MKKIHILFFLAILLLFTACGTTAFSVTMTEVSQAAETVTLKVSIDGTTYADLTFIVNDTAYTVSNTPTVSKPTICLSSSQDDGMEFVRLIMPNDSTSSAQLCMLPADGAEIVYTCTAHELQPLLDWMASN
ncbi:MAG: hypothetical protein IJA85_02800 [Clostridia bacterium]|nr:hypothetical protein [Clostridia bacterium]